jgi:cytochrome c peroxidase
MRITQLKEDSLKFKTPSLRNVMLTAPYMHDGRLWGIDEVYDHYTSSITYSPTLDPTLLYGIRLSAAERVNLTAFLYTLSDTTFTKDKRFSQP